MCTTCLLLCPVVQASQIFKAQHKQLDPAFLDKLEDYIEDLYEEDMAKKVCVGKAGQMKGTQQGRLRCESREAEKSQMQNCTEDLYEEDVAMEARQGKR